MVNPEERTFDWVLGEYKQTLLSIEGAERELWNDPEDEGEVNRRAVLTEQDEGEVNRRAVLTEQLAQAREEVKNLASELETLDPVRWAEESKKEAVAQKVRRFRLLEEELALLKDDYKTRSSALRNKVQKAAGEYDALARAEKKALDKIADRRLSLEASLDQLEDDVEDVSGLLYEKEEHEKQHINQTVLDGPSRDYGERRGAKLALNNKIITLLKGRRGFNANDVEALRKNLSEIRSKYGRFQTRGFARHVNRCLKGLDWLLEDPHDEHRFNQSTIHEIVSSVRQDNARRVGGAADREANKRVRKQRFRGESSGGLTREQGAHLPGFVTGESILKKGPGPGE